MICHHAKGATGQTTGEGMSKKIGRPIEYREEMCDRVIEVGMEGGSLMEMCFTVCRSYQTFQRWRQNYPEFKEAVKTAQNLSQVWWEKQGKLATFGGVEGFSAVSYIFQMKNRFRDDWRDRHEHTGPDGGAAIQVIVNRGGGDD